MTSTTAYLKSPWQTKLRTISLPAQPRAGWVRLRVDACGLCGTDVTSAITAKDWQPFGHEIAGTIIDLGENVDAKRLPAGTTVVVESASACGWCDVCRDAHPDLCRSGAPSIWGEPALGFSTIIDVPTCACVPYAGLAPEVASLTEPAGVAYDMVATADIRLGDRVCVVGPGPIALVAIALAFRRGASDVVCIGPRHAKARLALARDLGASIRFSDDAPALAALAKRFDRVLMTAPTEAIAPALAYLAYGGILTYIGIGTSDPTIAFDANDFHFRKLQLRASFASPAMYFPAVLRLLAAGAIPGEALISHTFPLDRIADALATARDDKANAIKIIVSRSGE
ncbi:MAG: zinc-dependent alcohol dehydrogenase [Kiritimatiellia bacterium]|jgi:L-iditol 2-dehydrogenase